MKRLLVLSLFSLISIHLKALDQEELITRTNKVEWTVLVFIQHGDDIRDTTLIRIAEILRGRMKLAQDDVHIYLQGYSDIKGHGYRYRAKQHALIYEGEPKVRGELSLDLVDSMRWVANVSPARKYMIMVWGNPFVDEYEDDAALELKNAALITGLKKISTDIIKGKIAMVCIDDAMLPAIELGYHLADHAHFLVSSKSSLLDYHALFKQLSSTKMSPNELALSLIKHYGNRALFDPPQTCCGCVAVNPAFLPQLKDNLDEIADFIIKALPTSSSLLSTVRIAFLSAKGLGKNDTNYVDIHAFYQRLFSLLDQIKLENKVILQEKLKRGISLVQLSVFGQHLLMAESDMRGLLSYFPLNNTQSSFVRSPFSIESPWTMLRLLITRPATTRTTDIDQSCSEALPKSEVLLISTDQSPTSNQNSALDT